MRQRQFIPILFFLLVVLGMASPSPAQTFKNINVADGLCNSVVKCFAQDPDGFMWMGTFDGLCRYDGYGFTTYRHSATNPASLRDGHVEALLSVGHQLFVGTASGLDVIDTRTRHITHATLPGGEGHFISNVKQIGQRVFVIDTYGNLWWAPRGTLSFRRHTPQGRELFQDVAPIDARRMLLLTDKHLLVVDNRTLRALSSTSVKALPTAGNTLYYSRNLRLAIIGSGIGHPSQAFGIGTRHVLTPADRRLPANVKAVEDVGCRTAFATDGDGLFFLSPHAAQATRLVPNDHFALHALYVDRDGNLWVGTYRNGVELAATGFDIFKRYNRQANHLTQNVVTALCADQHHIYAGTDGGGLNIIDRTTGLAHALTVANSQLPGDNIVAMAQGPDGLFLGIYGKGVCRYDLTTGTFRPITLPRQSVDVLWQMRPSGANRLAVMGQMTNIVDRTTGRLMACRRLQGRDLYEPLKASLGQVPTFRGLTVQSALTDGYGNLWVATDNGLFCRPKSSKAFLRFSASDRLPASQFCKDACATDGTSLFFGSTEGIVEVRPANLRRQHASSIVFFNGVSLLSGDTLLPAFGQQPEQVVLNHDQNFFTIRLAVPEYVFPGRVRLRYMLEGLDKDWRTADNVRDITYSGVPYGHYRFKVCATDGSGQWSDRVSELSVCVLPPWYLSLWAKAVWLLLLASAAYGAFRAWAYRQRLRYELRQKETKEQLERQANEDKLNFFVGITHELRTPMFLITAPLEELLDSPKRPVQVPYSYLKSMYRNALRLNKLVNRIIDIRKAPDGHMALTTQRRDLVKTCGRLEKDFRALCLQKHITFQFCPTLTELVADVDIEKLELMLSNLVTNAYKYTDEGGQVTLSLTTDGQQAIFCVADNGVGMTEEKMGHIFEPYYRVDQTGATEGSGVGLAFVARLVKTYGGTLRVASKPGEGTTFTLSLPLHPMGCGAQGVLPPVVDEAPATDTTPTDSIQDEHPAPTANPMAIRQVLVVDDEAGLRNMLASHLSQYYKVQTAHDGYEGIEQARALLPDVVVCDMMMPGMDGLEFVERMKADKTLAHIPIIMLTAKTLDDDRIRALQAGAKAYLTKPVSLKVLRAHIDQWLAGDAPTLHDSAIPLPKAEAGKGTPDDAKAQANEPKPTVSKEDERFILKCKAIIDQHLEDQSVDVEMLAETMGMSHSALYKRIKAVTGGSPADLILNYKLFKATSLFKAGETNITSVAYKCGFNSIHAFRATFKNRMGMTPSDYIKNM